MNNIPRWLILTLLLIATVACYFVGFMIGVGVFLAIGIIFELVFWLKLFKRNKKAE